LAQSLRRKRKLGFQDNPEYAYSFVLAERLGMTLEELGDRMGSREFTEWVVRDNIIAQEIKDQEETEELEARSKAGLKR